MAKVMSLAQEKPVVIFSKSSCCISHSIKALISKYDAYPAVHELDQLREGSDLERMLAGLGCNPAVPAVFIGGELIGGANAVMEHHIRGNLRPLLLAARAMYL